MVVLLSTGYPTQILVLFLCCGTTLQFSDDDLLATVTQIHHDQCPPLKYSCQIEPVPAEVWDISKPVCCGFCECNSECILQGSCCPGHYESLDMGRTAVANTR